MSLTDAQKQVVSQSVAEGKSIADIQRLLLEEHSVSMTYMEVRFLIDDLDVVFEEPETSESDEAVDEPEVVDEAAGEHRVTVETDAITPPGALMSGQTTFSDGVTLNWKLLSNGQLGLIPGDDNQNYRPSDEDMQDFRNQMDAILRKKGFKA